MTSPERLTIDATVARDYLDPERERHALAAELFELARGGQVELATAPQGFRLDLSGDLAEQMREAFEGEALRQARQVARVSEVTFPGEDLIVGHYVKGFPEAWDAIAAGWANSPGGADRFHTETHLADKRDVFITDDKRLLVMCGQLREEHGFPIVAMPIGDYLDKRRRSRAVTTPSLNRKLVWLVWAVTALVTIWGLLYVVGYYLGEVGN
jgi:hypothetical protein